MEQMRSRHGATGAPGSRDARPLPYSPSMSDTRRILQYLRGKAACVALAVLIFAIIRLVCVRECVCVCVFVCVRALSLSLSLSSCAREKCIYVYVCVCMCVHARSLSLVTRLTQTMGGVWFFLH